MIISKFSSHAAENTNTMDVLQTTEPTQLKPTLGLLE